MSTNQIYIVHLTVRKSGKVLDPKQVEATSPEEAATTAKSLFSKSYVTVTSVTLLDEPVPTPQPEPEPKPTKAPTEVPPLSHRAMLISCVINAWEARRTDKKISDEVAKAHNASVKVGNYNKSLLPECESHAKIFRVIGQARSFYKLSSLPWLQDGTRILLAEGYDAFADGIRAYREAFETSVEEFLIEYDVHVEAAKIALNGLFNPGEYPTKDQIRRKFRMRLVVCPMPDAGDFRVGLSHAAAESVRDRITEDVMDAMTLAQDEAWSRFREALGEFAERLSNPTAVYRDSLFNNLSDLLVLMPSLNIRRDPAMESLVSHVKEALSSTSPDTCRKDKDTRAQTAKRLEELLKLMPAPSSQ